MPKVLITGMSGTGKSTALRILGSRGHRTVETDTDRWSHWVTLSDGSSDWVWREQSASPASSTGRAVVVKRGSSDTITLASN